MHDFNSTSEHYDQSQAFLITSDGFIASSASEMDKLFLGLDTSELLSRSTVLIFDIDRTIDRPSIVLVDDKQTSEGTRWAYSNGLLTITGAARSVEISYVN